jgi:anti-anti-sigma regulatory factor
MTLTAPTVPTADDLPGGRGMWLTTMLRPAGSLTSADVRRFGAALRAASDSSGIVVVDLRAVGRLPRAAQRALTDADARLTRSGGALLVVDTDEVEIEVAAEAEVEVPARRSTAHLLGADS